MKNTPVKEFTSNLGATVQGRLKCAVIDAKTKQVVCEYPWQKNLILNQGMNLWFTDNSGGWAHQTTYMVVGTGTTPTRDDSGVTTAEQTGTTVTLANNPPGTFEFTDTGTDAGKMIKWDSGEEAMIVSVTSPTEAEVNISQSVAADEFTVFRTNQTGLTSESKRSNTHVEGTHGHDVLQPHEVEIYRSTDFSVEAGPVTYYEIGASRTNTVAANLFMRVLLDSPVSLLVDQQLRVTYRLRITMSPATPRMKTAVVPGWPIAPATSLDGGEAWEQRPNSWINSTGFGLDTFWDCRGMMISGGSFPGLVAMAATTHPLRAAPDSSNYNITSSTIYDTSSRLMEAYVSNSFQRVTYLEVTPAQANSDQIRNVGYSSTVPSFSSARYSYFRFLFNEAQTKENTHRLRWRFLWTAQRVLA